MTLEALILVAISLSLDAFGGSISRGASAARIPPGIALQVAGIFGAFAAVAPLAGVAPTSAGSAAAGAARRRSGKRRARRMTGSIDGG